MSINNGEMHVVAAIGAGTLTAAIGIFTILMIDDDADGERERPELEDMEAIEASLAIRKTPKKQPQKKLRQPDPIVKQEGVSRNENKVLDKQCCTSAADCTSAKLPMGTTCGEGLTCERNRCIKPKSDKTHDDKDLVAKIPDRREKDDLQVNDKPVTDVGEFNDNVRGFAETTSGHPFFQGLAADFHENWEFPKILSASGTAAGCLHILGDGTIKKTKLDPKSGDDALDDSIERALKKIEKLRNSKPEPVPTELLKQATTRWICFKSNPQEQQRE